mmetsp:Transcript_1170/g.2855  ORF Transcript_1170/g.2855 Transcript_1170/m.2855 type:complete len:282 (+) Transcript_1170:62-907(+)
MLLPPNLQNLKPQGLKHNSGIVNGLTAETAVAHPPCKILQKAVEVVVRELEDRVGGLERWPVVVRGAAKSVHHVLASGLLHTDQLGSFEKHIHPLVALQALEQTVQHDCDSVESTHSLEQFVLTVQNTLFDCQFKPDCASRCDVWSCSREHQQCILSCSLVHPDVFARFQKQCGQHIEMIVRNVDVVVGLTQPGGIVRFHPTKAPDEIIGELSADLPLLVLSAFKVELHTRILQAPVKQVLHGSFHVGIPAEAFDEGNAIPNQTLLLPFMIAENRGTAGLD